MIDKELSSRMGVRSSREVLLGISRGIDDTVRVIEERMKGSGPEEREFLSALQDHLDYLNGDYVARAMVCGGYPDAPSVPDVSGGSLGGRYGESCFLFCDGLGDIRFHRGRDDFEYERDGVWRKAPVMGVDCVRGCGDKCDKGGVI